MRLTTSRPAVRLPSIGERSSIPFGEICVLCTRRRCVARNAFHYFSVACQASGFASVKLMVSKMLRWHWFQRNIYLRYHAEQALRCSSNLGKELAYKLAKM